MTMPDALGLPAEEAEARLAQNGFITVEVCASGRRREGRPRVIRQKLTDDKVELVVSYFKELDISETILDEKIPPAVATASPLGSAPSALTREGREF